MICNKNSAAEALALADLLQRCSMQIVWVYCTSFHE